MKFSKFVLPLLLALPLVASCGPTGEETSTSGQEETSTSEGGGTGGTGDTTDYGDPVAFDGLVRIYYHNDQNDYATKRLWIWAAGVDGSELGETSFTNQLTPDDYGVYYDLDLSAEPFGGMSLASISFIVKEAGSWAGQSKDIAVPFNKFISNKTTTEEGREMITVYGVQGNGGTIDTYTARNDALGDRVGDAYFSAWDTLTVRGTGTAEEGREEEDIGKIASYKLYGFDNDYYRALGTAFEKDKEDYLITSGTPNSKEVTITLEEEADPMVNYVIEATFAQNTAKVKSAAASFNSLYDSEKFQNEYVYDGDDLGFTINEEGKAQYKLWAPTASRVQLFLYVVGVTAEINESGEVSSITNTYNNHVTREMTPGEHGVWTYVSDGAMPTRRFYTYYVTTAAGSQETIDPYAHAAGINGLRGYAMDAAAWAAPDAEPEGFDESIERLETEYAISAPNELSVYEAHIRDLTMDETWTGKNKPGTYLAFAEEGTTYTGMTPEGEPLTVKTGFDHIVETGVNAVQLLPVFDQDNDERTVEDEEGNVILEPNFNWGYNPLNYNVVEGSYSSDPFDPLARIYEYKTLIKAFADKGIRIIMDVVYNHLASVGNNCFNKVIPDYFFRKNADGAYIDGSGTGNVTASERPMVRKYIVDSVCFWAEQYGIKGFRFDLMGCLDVTTMRAVKDALYDIDPQIVVYGEGWNGAFGNPDGTGLPAEEEASNSHVYSKLYDNGKGSVGCFNDGGRDALKGNTQWEGGKPDYGFLTQGAEHVGDKAKEAAAQFLGINERAPGANPAQTVNYVACHDNYTLYDQMNFCMGSGMASAEDNDDAIWGTVALNAAMALSQGIAFLNGGDEIFRQKLLYPEDPFYAVIENLQEDDPNNTDAFKLEDGTMLVRNSYNYGDECNSFKWDRKVTYHEAYLKTIEAFHLRNEMMGHVFGMDYETDIKDDQHAWVWGNLCEGVNMRTSTGAVFAPEGEEYYVMLGGRTLNPWTNLGIGNGTLEVVYSSNDKHTSDTTFNIDNGIIGIARSELLLLKRVS